MSIKHMSLIKTNAQLNKACFTYDIIIMATVQFSLVNGDHQNVWGKANGMVVM